MKFCSMPPLVYSREGQDIMKRLYEETLTALSFAGVRDILQTMRVGTNITQKSM
jgi:hypothetical protein